MSDITTATETKPLRRDAERNRQRILDAARELFVERGLGVTLNDIAHHAGVGVGTVYRRFPDKTRLIDDLLEQRYAEMVALMDRAVTDPDPWHGVVGFLEGALALQAEDRAMQELVCSMPDGLDRVRRLRDLLLPRGEELVRRAREAGHLHPDIDTTDLAVVQLMLSAVIDAARNVKPELWRRYLGIFLRGISPQAQSIGPLSPAPLARDEIDLVMTAAKRGRSQP